MSLEYEMQLQELRQALSLTQTTVSRAINVLQQVGLALDEDDVDEAKRLIAEATAE